MTKKLSYKEAAVRLKITVRLLKWFQGHSPKRDGRKLVVSKNGLIEEDELLAFDAYLRSEWPSKYVPKGIEREIRCEAKGTCGLCEQRCNKPEMAHIERKDFELKYHCQHPHNLLSICGDCHNRYDSDDTSIDHDVVRQAKDNRLSALLEGVGRDVAAANLASKIIEEEVAKAVAKALSEITPLQLQSPVPSAQFWQQQTKAIHDAIQLPPDSGVQTDVSTPSQFKDTVVATAKHCQPNQPATSGVLQHYAGHIFSTDADAPKDDPWDYIPDDVKYPVPEPQECQMGCGEATLIEFLYCCECGIDNYDLAGEEIYSMESAPEGGWLFSVPDGRGKRDVVVTCEECGCNRMEAEFESFCSYHKHMISKDD